MPFVRRHPFLLLGLLTLGWFFGVDALNRAGHPQAAAVTAPALRVFIIPMYVVWLLFSMLNVVVLGPVGAPSEVTRLISVIAFAAGLTPYALADYLLARWRRPHVHREPTT